LPGLTLNVNGRAESIESGRDSSLLIALREELGLTGAKYGCGEGECGSCTVLIDGEAVRSCVTPVDAAVGKHITTIEGLASGEHLHPLQQAWIDVQVPQCGYCQSGQILEAVALLRSNEAPAEEQIRAALAGHICSCGTYNQVVAAVQLAASRAAQGRTD
jgi:isoquinoline 1-oxidoreductase subunit alpha